MKVKELKKGAIFSYLLILANSFYGLFFTPYLISALGDGQYGVYKIIASLAGSITILDLGIGSTVLRYVAYFNAKNEKKNLSNFCAMAFIQTAIISAVMVAACGIVYFCIDGLYSKSLTPDELRLAKNLFLIFIVMLVINNYEKVIFSMVAGCEHYSFANMTKLMSIILRVILLVFALMVYPNAEVILLSQIAATLVVMMAQWVHIKKKIGLKIKYYFWDNSLFLQSFKYTALMFIQSLAVQLNGNLDNMVIGSIVGSAAVAVYSVGLQLYGMYEQFAMAFSDLMLPTVSKQIADGASERELEDTVIKVGRLEFMALGAALCGFIVIGREFIELWLGKGYTFAWTVGLILMIPTTVPLIQNVSLSILRAKNKMGFRTAAVCFMALFNLIITIVGVRLFGAIAACVGTAIGLIGANIIAMNIYYVKVVHLNVFRIFANILKRTWLCCVISVAAVMLADRFIGGTWFLWLVKVVIFCVIYGILLIIYGMNDSEKKVLFGKIMRKNK